MDDNFELVKFLYPNEWRRNISEIGVTPGIFNWFLCSKRAYDRKLNLYYVSISPDIQFYSEESGDTLLARGLKRPNDDDPTKKETKRARLLILSDPYNKKTMCREYGLLCGCDSNRDILSTECDLVNNISLMIKGAKKAVEIGFDGVVIRYECMRGGECGADCGESPICQNATFLFYKPYKILEIVKNPDRCWIVKYSKKHNLELRIIVPDFPTIDDINESLKKKNCKEVSKSLFLMINKYIEKKSKI